MVGACSAGDQSASAIFSSSSTAFDKLQRQRPVQPHSPLGSVHRLGHSEAKRPQMFAVCNCCVPVHDWMSKRLSSTQGVHNYVGRGEGDAALELVLLV